MWGRHSCLPAGGRQVCLPHVGEPNMISGLFRRRRLPHWDVDDGTYFVTTCLDGSIPAQGFVQLNKYRQELDARCKPNDLTDDEWELRKQKFVFARFDQWIDLKPAKRHLQIAE